jgi:hypothetical protein
MKNSMRHALSVALLAGSALCLTAPSYAADSGHPAFHSSSGHPSRGGPPAGSAPHWGGAAGYRGPHVSFAPHGDFAHFSPAQRSAWVGGHWNHGWHNGHFGWWWFAGGAWFFYDEPIYPYPAYVADEYVDDFSDDYDGGQYWYYCQNPAGYYPYVQRCGSPWQPVPPTPPPPGAYGPPPGYGQGPNDQGPPGYQQGPGDQGPPPGYQGPPQGGPGDQGPPPPPGNGQNN